MPDLRVILVLAVVGAYAAIDWKVIFLLGGVIPLGLAIDQTGAAAWLASTALEPFLGFGPLVVLAVLYLVTAVLTETMSNNAAAVLLAPIALSLANALGRTRGRSRWPSPSPRPPASRPRWATRPTP
ncbi:MAG: SLC13 family permease [Deferrisomatales bacterium]|nr:SLC13 family permease [Deferrisomatales bacterium]